MSQARWNFGPSTLIITGLYITRRKMSSYPSCYQNRQQNPVTVPGWQTVAAGPVILSQQTRT